MMSQGKKFSILVCEPMAKDGLDMLTKEAHLQVDSLNLSRNELLSKIGSYDALLVRSQTSVDKELIDKASNLKLIGRAGVGIDNIDVKFAKEKNIAVINTPTGNSIAACEMAFALMLALARKIPWAHAATKSGAWKRDANSGCELANKTLGLLGFGNVGRLLSKRAQAFDMKVIAHDPQVPDALFLEHNVKSVSFDELLKADFVSLHASLNDSTKNIINEKSLSKAKPGIFLINTARGELVDDQALIAALNTDQVAYAALDVFKKEPPDPKDHLLNHPKIICTPHLGASTKEAQLKVSTMLAEQVIEFFKKF